MLVFTHSLCVRCVIILCAICAKFFLAFFLWWGVGGYMDELVYNLNGFISIHRGWCVQYVTAGRICWFMQVEWNEFGYKFFF